MKLDPTRLMGFAFPARAVTYDARETMLYALAVGMAADPAEPGELAYAYEATQRVVPSFATALAFDDTWLEAGGIDLRHVVHGALHLRCHAPLPAAATVSVTTRVAGLSDKSEGRAGIVLQEAAIHDAAGVSYATVLSTLFVRGAGGFGGSVGQQPAPHAVPERAPDEILRVPTMRNQALLFRLLGDRNPLHADPAAAEAAGFQGPILHGACTFGIACAALLRACCGLDPDRLATLAARFAGPLYPGEILRFTLWHDGDAVAFRAHADARDALVLDNGHARLRR